MPPECHHLRSDPAEDVHAQIRGPAPYWLGAPPAPWDKRSCLHPSWAPTVVGCEVAVAASRHGQRTLRSTDRKCPMFTILPVAVVAGVATNDRATCTTTLRKDDNAPIQLPVWARMLTRSASWSYETRKSACPRDADTVLRPRRRSSASSKCVQGMIRCDNLRPVQTRCCHLTRGLSQRNQTSEFSPNSQLRTLHCCRMLGRESNVKTSIHLRAKKARQTSVGAPGRTGSAAEATPPAPVQHPGLTSENSN